jgi:hypothetical protein
MSSFGQLKKKSQANIDALSREIDKITKSSESYRDDRFWTPERDKTGNGYAVIRFLPPSEGEDLPWVRLFSHGFQGKGGWFIENCPTTLGLPCPVCEKNSELWNSGVESDKEIARARKRKLNYISNIYVVSDPANKQNEGKVFLYKYGKKIFDKISEKMKPQFEDETPMNPFDFWAGASFKLKIRTVQGYVNYDKSEFDTSSEFLDGNDKELEKIWNLQHSLREFVSPSQFKGYEELSTKFGQVIQGSSSAGKSTIADVESDESSFEKKFSSKTKSSSFDTAEDEDAMSYFEKLVEDE